MSQSTAVAPARRENVRLPYLPALDGLRGLALVAILLLHGGVDQVPGGHLALTAFFTLSGFLITSLLLVERHRTGTIDLRVFWTRRARRLVPALVLTFPLIAVVVLLSEAPPSDGLLLDAVAAATWVANWRFVLADQKYADLFSLPSPFQHFWSLAVEEQFYLLFPLVLMVVLGLRSARARTGRLALLLGLLVVASTVQVARLATDDGLLGRAYYGTDARLAEILVGSLLALALVGPEGLRPLTPRVRCAVGAAGVAGLVGLAVLMLTLAKDSPLTYRGGFLLAALSTAGIVAAGTQPGSAVTRLLSLRPLVWLGLLSYGVYLFHWPLFLLLTERYTGLGPVALLALRFAVVIGLAWLSFTLLERPVRTGGLPALPALGGWATGAVAGVVVVAAAATTVTMPGPVLVQQAQPAAPEPSQSGPRQLEPQAPPPQEGPTEQPVQAAAAPAAAPSVAPAPAAAAAPAPPPKAPAPPVQAALPSKFLQDPADAPVPTLPPPTRQKLRVAVVGDSISHDLATGLQRWSRTRKDIDVVSFAVAGCPLSRGGDRRVTPDRPFPVEPECGWWDRAGDERRARFEQYRPHLVLAEAGIDEVFDRRQPDWGGWRQPGHPQFDQWLVNEYRTMARQWTGGGAKLLLANAPCADWDRFQPFRDMKNGNLRVAAVNLDYAAVTGVEAVDLHGRVCPNGQYSDDVEGVKGGRFDGIHFTEEAQDALARNWLGPLLVQAGAGMAASG